MASVALGRPPEASELERKEDRGRLSLFNAVSNGARQASLAFL